MMLVSGMFCIMFRHSVRMATRAFVQVIGELLITSCLPVRFRGHPRPRAGDDFISPCAAMDRQVRVAMIVASLY